MSGLRSTHKPSAAALAASAPLPAGWTEHKAPTGHTYYYNAETKTSTYTRPGAEVAPPVAPQPPHSFDPYANLPSLADPSVANAYLAQFNKPAPSRGGPSGGRGRGGFEARPRPQPSDKPRGKEVIPGCEPWILVYTKYSRRFVYNPVKNASYWRIPEKLMPAILEMDKLRIQGKVPGDSKEKGEEEGSASTTTGKDGDQAPQQQQQQQADEENPFDSDEYEEVEVTDDEDVGDDAEDEHRSKRQRVEEGGDEEEEDQGPVEFTEDDIAMQLRAMGEQYDLEPGDFDDGHTEDWPEGAEGLEFSEEDGNFLFKDMLLDLNISPYSRWEQLLEDGKIIEDVRYTALSTTKARKDCFDEWSRERIAELKEQRAKQEKKDPRIAYMAFLQEKATPKLYWPEFKRKHKKEDAMKDLQLSDKDREKAYREHINRLKLPQASRKSDLTTMLKAQPVHLLHNKSLANGLPTAVLTDIRYISLEPEIRDPLIEAYVQTLPPPPEDVDLATDDAGRSKARDARERRERALAGRNQMIEEQRRRRERGVAASKARLRDEERELEMAMRVGKRGLQSQLASNMPNEPPKEDA